MIEMEKREAEPAEDPETLRKAFNLACRMLEDYLGNRWDKWQKYFMERAESERVCRVCGCTDDHACEGGCWWAEPDLCSRCAGKGKRANAD